jgi:phosphonate transport system substrate-binding protein
MNETRSTRSRRQALRILLGACGSLPLLDADSSAPVRLAISESLVADVNITDARAATRIWINRLMTDLDIKVELSPRVFDTTEEIIRRARTNTFDAVALNVVEYRQIADCLDPSQIIVETGVGGLAQYVLLAKRNSGIQHLSNLHKRGLCILKSPKMCVASAWLTTILEESHCGPAGQFFASVTAESKISRVVLPVFFGQTDACLASKQGFDTMCELNPQVAKDLTVIAASVPLVVNLYIFHKKFHGMSREKFAKVYMDVPSSPAGHQVATLFQFESLAMKDVTALGPALALLELADRAQGGRDAGARK